MPDALPRPPAMSLHDLPRLQMRQVGVGGGHRPMPEHALDQHRIGALAQQLDGVRVSQAVRVDALGDAGAPRQARGASAQAFE